MYKNYSVKKASISYISTFSLAPQSLSVLRDVDVDARIWKPVKNALTQLLLILFISKSSIEKPVLTPLGRNRSINTSGPVPALSFNNPGKIVQTRVNMRGLSSKKTLYKMTHFSNMPRYRKLLVTVAQDFI